MSYIPTKTQFLGVLVLLLAVPWLFYHGGSFYYAETGHWSAWTMAAAFNAAEILLWELSFQKTRKFLLLAAVATLLVAAPAGVEAARQMIVAEQVMQESQVQDDSLINLWKGQLETLKEDLRTQQEREKSRAGFRPYIQQTKDDIAELQEKIANRIRELEETRQQAKASSEELAAGHGWQKDVGWLRTAIPWWAIFRAVFVAVCVPISVWTINFGGSVGQEVTDRLQFLQRVSRKAKRHTQRQVEQTLGLEKGILYKYVHDQLSQRKVRKLENKLHSFLEK